jgi:archaellum biogenesis protein FlaJ (TadC family)
MYNHASRLSSELVYFKESLNSCQAELETEKIHSCQLDVSRVHGALIFASLAVAAFIAFVLPCPLFIAVTGIVGISVLSFVLWFVAFGIVQILYSHHPKMYEMHEKEDKTSFAAALAAPVILAASCQLIKFFAQK